VPVRLVGARVRRHGVPRLRREAVPDSTPGVPGVPVELAGPHPIWDSVDTSKAWLERNGLIRRLRADGELRAMTPQERLSRARELWEAKQVA
jgi:hypothetical protein